MGQDCFYSHQHYILQNYKINLLLYIINITQINPISKAID